MPVKRRTACAPGNDGQGPGGTSLRFKLSLNVLKRPCSSADRRQTGISQPVTTKRIARILEFSRLSCVILSSSLIKPSNDAHLTEHDTLAEIMSTRVRPSQSQVSAVAGGPRHDRSFCRAKAGSIGLSWVHVSGAGKFSPGIDPHG